MTDPSSVFSPVPPGRPLLISLSTIQTSQIELGISADHLHGSNASGDRSSISVRQNPLERDIKIASSERDARALFAGLAEENFLSGWEKAV